MVATRRHLTRDVRLADLISTSDRASAILLYHRRLARLLALEPTADANLTDREQDRLRGRAMLTTIQALTDLDAGAVASELLRETGRRRRRAERRRERDLAPSD
jgi:hypothetical protein